MGRVSPAQSERRSASELLKLASLAWETAIAMDPRALQRFRRNKGALAGLLIVAALALFAILVPLLSHHSPNIPDFEYGRGRFGTPAMPSSRHWLGTDTIFRDELVRLAYGGRLSLKVALVATVIASSIGTLVGVLSGYFRGIVDSILMRFVDMLLAFPFLLLLMALSAPSIAQRRQLFSCSTY